ncbi:DNA-binding protein [Burkholderia glumae]|uniref:DNA-binding protein n=1 Tax=Burkholderia glumae TaxID=337 RepID=UPI00056A6218|nr:DNA-binding protein [Burkholderia glumae]QKM57783.1 hypothetical protein CG017_05863 [Burkholderia glumae]
MNAVSPFPKHSNALVNAFSDAELVLIFKIHTLVPPAELLALIRAQRLADRRDTAVPPTLEQLLRTLATLAKPARAQDWGDLRHLIEGAWLVGALDELSPRVIATVQALIMRGESHRDWPLDEAAVENGVSLARVETLLDDGRLHITTAEHPGTRAYIAEPMVQRLRDELAHPNGVADCTDGRVRTWATAGQAAQDAGVTTATLYAWAKAGDLERRFVSGSWRYSPNSVRARARRYWTPPRVKRARPPQWLLDEREAAALEAATLPPPHIAGGGV